MLVYSLVSTHKNNKMFIIITKHCIVGYRNKIVLYSTNKSFQGFQVQLILLYCPQT